MFCGDLVPHLQGSCMGKGHSYTGKWKPWKFKTGKKKFFWIWKRWAEFQRCYDTFPRIIQFVIFCTWLYEILQILFLLKHFCSPFTSQLQFLFQISSYYISLFCTTESSAKKMEAAVFSEMFVPVYYSMLLHIRDSCC